MFVPTLTGQQTSFHCIVLCHSPYFAATAAAFAFYFHIQCAYVVFAWLKKCCRFFVSPSPQSTGDVFTAAVTTPINF
jgi:hypothetical protein